MARLLSLPFTAIVAIAGFVCSHFPALQLSWVLFTGPALIGDKAHAPLFPKIDLLSHLSHNAKNPGQRGSIPPIFWIATTLQLGLGILFLPPCPKT